MNMATTMEHRANKLLQIAGIHINGHQPWDIQIRNNRFYARVLKDGALGLGESYMDEWWDCEQLDVFFERVLRAGLDEKVNRVFQTKIKNVLAKIINFQSKHRAKDVAKKHYNLGNNLFEAMLDPYMIYSCGYWQNVNNLADAQQEKLKLICEKLQLKPGMRLLDIGCGWGGLARYAAENYSVKVVGVTISKEQHAYAKEYCKNLPVEIRLQDYRDLNEHFDRIVSVGMFEHVGHPNYDTFMCTANRCLSKDGLFLLHTIGVNVTTLFANDWIIKYIFPHGMLPSVAQIAKAAEPYFVIEDWHNFSAYYDPTLMSWHKNFVAHWDKLKASYDERFYRMWTYYLLSCAGGFRARAIQLWQVMFSKHGIVGGYIAAR